MHLFSTVLFVNGNPVGYKIEKQNNRILLSPAENPNRETAPRIEATERQGEWLVEGTTDRNLIEQVIEDMANCNRFISRTPFSAAP